MRKKRTDYITLAEMKLICGDCYEEMKAQGVKKIPASMFFDIEKAVAAAEFEETGTSAKEGISPQEAYDVGKELGAFPANVPLNEAGNPISGPKPVTRYYEKCMKKKKQESYCARVAWSIYCAYKNPGYEGCTEYGRRWGAPYSSPIG
jgi:hypothetical protein